MRAACRMVAVLGLVMHLATQACAIEVGDILVSRYFDNAIDLYDGQSGARIGPVASNISGVDGICFLQDGSLAAVSSSAGEVYRYNGQTGAYQGVLCGTGLSNPRKVAQAPDGTVWVTNNDDNYDMIGFDPASGTEVGRISGFSFPYIARAVAFGNGRMYVAARHYGGDYANVHQYDPSTGAYLGNLGPQFATALDEIAVAPDGSVIVAAAADNWRESKLLRLDKDTGAVLGQTVGYYSEALAVGSDQNLRAIYVGGGGSALVTLEALSLQQTAILNPSISLNGFQDMTVKPIPGPATLSLLAVGGLAVLRRRRRK